MSSNIIQPRPIDKAFDKIAELKVLIKKQENQIENISNILVEMSKQLKDLKDFKEKEVIEKERARAGWFY
jgi:flagellar biosynthesis chaperone FliJ